MSLREPGRQGPFKEKLSTTEWVSSELQIVLGDRSRGGAAPTAGQGTKEATPLCTPGRLLT